MEYITNSDENRERLARSIVESMEEDDLLEAMVEVHKAHFKSDDNDFQEQWKTYLTFPEDEDDK